MDRLSTDVGSAAFNDYGAGLRRRWKVVLLGLLLGLAAGAALLALQPKQYTSTTLVLVEPVGTSAVTLAGGRTSSEINLDTESQLVRSAQVADAARTLLRTDESVVQLLERVAITVPPNSQVLSIAYTGATAKGAQEGSHAFAQAYLSNRTTEARREVDLTVAGLTSQLKAAQAQLKSLTDRTSTLVAGSPDQVYADAQRNVVVSQINDLTSRLAPLQTSTPSPGQIITDAPLPQKASSPVPALDLGGGLVLGLLLGLAAAVALDRRDQRLRGADDVTRHVGLPVLADIPSERAGNGLPGEAQGPVFDRLRNSLIGFDPAARPLQVTDPGGRGASGLVALQLARSLARVHGEATLVVAHPSSVLPGVTEGEGRPGLVEVLRGELALHDVRYQVASLPGVTVIPPGRAPEELEALLQSPTMSSVLSSLRGSSSGVVLETLGTGESAAAQTLAVHSQAVLLVAERGRTEAGALSEASRAATRMGSEVAGVVLVPALSRREQAAPRRDRKDAEQRDSVEPVQQLSTVPAGQSATPASGSPSSGAGTSGTSGTVTPTSGAGVTSSSGLAASSGSRMISSAQPTPVPPAAADRRGGPADGPAAW